MYDWANSAYALVILTAIFPKVFDEFAGDSPTFLGIEFSSSGSLYSSIMSASYFILMIITPVLGAYADRKGRKRIFLILYTLLGTLACFLLAKFDSSNLWLGILGTLLGSLSFSGSLVFYNAYLPEIAPLDQQDKVSAQGYALGYIGSVILLIAILYVSFEFEAFGFDSALDVFRSSFIWVGIWWISFAMFTFFTLPVSRKKVDDKESPLVAAFTALKKSWNTIVNIEGGKWFLLTFFILSVGIKAILILAPIVAIQLVKMTSTELITVVLILQVLAVIGAKFLSVVAEKKGNDFALIISAVLFLLVCVGAYYVESKTTFYVLSVLVGFAMGGIQTLLRSSYSKLVYDSENHAALFSYYDWVEKVASLVGTGIFAFVAQFSDSFSSIAPERIAMLSLSVFFIAGGYFLFLFPKKGLKV
jgi:UMF1 family MFS transporter